MVCSRRPLGSSPPMTNSVQPCYSSLGCSRRFATQSSTDRTRRSSQTGRKYRDGACGCGRFSLGNLTPERHRNALCVEIGFVSNLVAKNFAPKDLISVLGNRQAKVACVIHRDAEVPLHIHQGRDVGEQIQKLVRKVERWGL